MLVLARLMVVSIGPWQRSINGELEGVGIYFGLCYVIIVSNKCNRTEYLKQRKYGKIINHPNGKCKETH